MVLTLVCIAASAAASGAPHQVIAAEDGQAEIIVTGERVPRSLRETPSSVVVLTEDSIESQAGVDRLDQLLEQIPNIQVGSGGQGPTFRGQDSTGVLQDLPAFLGGTRSRVALQVDGRAVSYNDFVNGVTGLWDVERVEVFRSPQSTTQGRNSIAGAIFVHTNDPLYEWEGRARLTHGNLRTWQGSALISGPIVKDQLAFRLSGDARTSRNPNKVVDPAITGANPNRDRYVTVRGKLLAEPVALPGLMIQASYVHQDSRQPPAEGVTPPFEERRGSRGAAVFDIKVDSLTTEAQYAASDQLQFAATLSAGRARSQRFAVPGLGETVTDVRDRSLETRIDWRPSDRLKARLGLHELRTRLDQFIDLTRVFGIGEFADRQRSVGLFGELEFKPAEQVSVIAGLRYQRDRQDRDGSLGNPVFPTVVDFDRTFEGWLPKLSLSYEIADGVAAGVLVQRAYNPGGITINFDTGQQAEFGQESLWSYELFGRASLAGGRLWLTANLFHTDFQNAQRAEQRAFTVPGQGTAFWFLIYNIREARSHGLETSVEWRPFDRVRLRGALGILRTRIGDDAPAAFAGKQFSRSPHFSGTASIEWGPIDRLRLNADIRHHGRYFSDDLNTPSFRITRATVVNARASYEAGRLTVFGYARNLLDSFYVTSQFSQNFATTLDPREIGGGVDFRF